MLTSSSGRANGSELKKNVLMNEKIAVLAPMPSPRVRTAISVKPGDLTSRRRARRRSVSMGWNVRSNPVVCVCWRKLVGTERDQRVNLGGAARGDEAGDEGHGAEHQGD